MWIRRISAIPSRCIRAILVNGQQPARLPLPFLSRPVNEIKRIWRRASHRVVVARRYLLPSRHSDLSIDHPPASLRHKEPGRVVGSSPLDRDWTVMTRNNDEAASRSGGKRNADATPGFRRIDFVLGPNASNCGFFYERQSVRAPRVENRSDPSDFSMFDIARLFAVICYLGGRWTKNFRFAVNYIIRVTVTPLVINVGTASIYNT